MKYLEYAKHIGADEFVEKWVKTTLKNYIEKANPSTEEVEHILDYLVQSGKKVSKMSYPEAKSNAEKWMKTQIKKGNSIEEKPEDTEIVLDFNDGFKIVKLIGENAYKREGFLMRHCCASYFGKDVEIYSLRDKDNVPHCTMERDRQIKGRGNGDIHPKYVHYVVKFLEHTGMTVGDAEMKHLGYLNFEKVKKYLHKDTQFYNEVYLPKDEKLIGKDGNEFASLDLLDIKDLVSYENDELKIQFNLKTFIGLSISFLLEKSKKIIKDSSRLAASGYNSHLAASGYNSHLAASGDSSHLAASGDNSRLAASGYNSHLAASGDNSRLAASGDYSQLEVNGRDSVGANIGINGIIKGKIGCWITLAEYEEINNVFKPVCVLSILIDGKEIKEDTWYKLSEGKFVEVE